MLNLLKDFLEDFLLLLAEEEIQRCDVGMRGHIANLWISFPSALP